MTKFNEQALHSGFPKPLMQTSVALSETRHSGYERLAGPVLSSSICGLRSTFSGLQSNELNDECFFSFQKPCFKRDTDPWNWSRGKAARMATCPLQSEGQTGGRDRLSSRCIGLTPSRNVHDNGTRGQIRASGRAEIVRPLEKRRKCLMLRGTPKRTALPTSQMPLTHSSTKSFSRCSLHTAPGFRS